MPDKKSSLLTNLIDLCQTPSPSLHERGAAKVLARKIRELGYEPLEDDVGKLLGGDCGNLVVKVPGSGKGPRLLLSAHMDTVEKKGATPAVAKVEGEWVSREGGGILGADDKTGIAVLLEVLARLAARKEPRHGDLLFVFTVAEEIEGLGSAELDPELYRGLDGGVILDYTSPEEIVIAAPTKVTFRCTVHGVGGHAAHPEGKINAAHVMAQTLARLPVGRLDEHTTVNLGVMHSGTAINVIPGSAYAEYEIRSHRKDVLDYHVKRIIGIIEGVVRENRVFSFGPTTGMGDADSDKSNRIRYSQVDVDVEVAYEGYRLAEDSHLVKLLVNAAKRTGLSPRLVTAQGGSDANILNRRNLPSAVVGCGMYGAHGDNERANLRDMEKAVDMIMHLVSPPRASIRSKGSDA